MNPFGEIGLAQWWQITSSAVRVPSPDQTLAPVLAIHNLRKLGILNRWVPQDSGSLRRVGSTEVAQMFTAPPAFAQREGPVLGQALDALNAAVAIIPLAALA